jgi:hypothetical protein
MIKINEIDGLLLCAVCENQLYVDTYSGGYGFFQVYPCEHCKTDGDKIYQPEPKNYSAETPENCPCHD